MEQELLQRSIESRNRQAIKNLVEIESLREWGKSETNIVLPKYEKIKVKRSVWWLNFFKSSVMQLMP